MINRIAHIGIAVKDLEERIAFYRDVLGLHLESREELPERNLRIAVFNLNGVHIELLEPTSPDSNVAVFIEKRGEGLHHIAFGDDDIKGTQLLLHKGKSEMPFFRTARARPNQLWNDGSLILYRFNRPSASVSAAWAISPRQPSARETTRLEAAGASEGTISSPEAGASSCSRMIRADCPISTCRR
jgi:methylmalonyl-CoA epimerase